MQARLHPAAITRAVRRPAPPAPESGGQGAASGARLARLIACYHDILIARLGARRAGHVGGSGGEGQKKTRTPRVTMSARVPAGLPRPLSRIHRTKLDEAGCRAAGEFGGRAGVRRAAPEPGAVAQHRSGALRVRARGCARRGRACWREPRTRVGAVSERQAGSGIARSRASAAASCSAQGQRFGRCRVHRRAERVSRPAREK